MGTQHKGKAGCFGAQTPSTLTSECFLPLGRVISGGILFLLFKQFTTTDRYLRDVEQRGHSHLIRVWTKGTRALKEELPCMGHHLPYFGCSPCAHKISNTSGWAEGAPHPALYSQHWDRGSRMLQCASIHSNLMLCRGKFGKEENPWKTSKIQKKEPQLCFFKQEFLDHAFIFAV